MSKPKLTNEYIEKDDYTILLIKGSKHGDAEILIDTEDVEKVKKHRWTINPYGLNEKKFYYYVVASQGLLLHRYIMNNPKDLVVDHKDNNAWNNRKNNLKICTVMENKIKQTLSIANKSGYPGVIWYDYHNVTPKWVAYITVNKKRIHLGSFTDLEEAIKVRKEAEKKYFGEYQPNLNVSEDLKCFGRIN